MKLAQLNADTAPPPDVKFDPDFRRNAREREAQGLPPLLKENPVIAVSDDPDDAIPY